MIVSTGLFKSVMQQHKWLSVLRDCQCNYRGQDGERNKALGSYDAWVDHIAEILEDTA